jgi:hypothetical protein
MFIKWRISSVKVRHTLSFDYIILQLLQHFSTTIYILISSLFMHLYWQCLILASDLIVYIINPPCWYNLIASFVDPCQYGFHKTFYHISRYVSQSRLRSSLGANIYKVSVANLKKAHFLLMLPVPCKLPGFYFILSSFWDPD